MAQGYYNPDELAKIHEMELGILKDFIGVCEKHNLTYSVCYKRLNLPYDFTRLPASLTSSHIRHNTVTAEVIAAKHNVYS